MVLAKVGKTGLLMALLLALVACSTLPKIELNEQSQQKWSQYQLQAGRYNSWNLSGRAAIFVDDEVHNIGLKWQRNAESFEMTLEAPLGQGVFRLQSRQNAINPVKLALPDGQVFYGNDAEETLFKVVGWSIPVNGLEFWIRGIPQKTPDFNYDLNGDGRLRSLMQDGWTINYLGYFDHEDPSRGLPRKMHLKHNGLALKIVVDRWQKPETADASPELFPEFN